MAQAEDGIRDHCVTGVQTCALPIRSEEHTSELQSHSDLVCRLLLEIEKGQSERSRINVGDTIRFDVVGRIVEARVTSVRDVQWEDARSGGFMFVFRPGPLDHAPQTWIGILKAPEDPSARGRFQRDLVAEFPNVSAIDLREVLATVKGAVDNVTLAISIVGGIALVSGVLILAGAVAMTKFQRVYEAAILRTLGASTRMLGAMLALEYGGLGLLAGALGAARALAPARGGCRAGPHHPPGPPPPGAAAAPGGPPCPRRHLGAAA